MPEKYLFDRLVEEFGRRSLAEISLPGALKGNLNPVFELRPYQIDAFQRFICYFEKSFDFKEIPTHLLFNMATGSGKTLIMAGLILYLYEKGYRNFLFFVNSTNIIEKTKDNFLNPASIKYLFNREIVISNKRVQVSPVENFEAANSNAINICFTTIQKLHSDLTTERENSITFEDFRKHRVVLIADEAHHINVQTRAEQELFESWENTVQKIFEQNRDNLLLEFTATHDYETPAMVNKYRNKVIMRYDLLQFRNDRYSKDVVIVLSDFSHDDRILQALVLNQYKQAVAAQHRINLKPVILFKAQRLKAQSKENKENFHRLIENLTAQQLAHIRTSNIEVIQRAFRYFDDNQISAEQLVERLKRDFAPEFCLSVNEESEKEQHQILLNTLEDKHNRIRAIFAVQKLNEGWDVLNLFDIVRCYQTRDSGAGVLGRTTISEAQLIGRGARYFPFVLPENNDRYRRKFDSQTHELRVLEELHYHSINDNRYISEIRDALVAQGIMNPGTVDRDLNLKETFKKTDFYKMGVIYVNSREVNSYREMRSFSDFGVSRQNFVHIIATGRGGEGMLLAGGQQAYAMQEEARKDLPVREIERNIIQSAIARCPFFTFASIKHYFPQLTSIQEFIASENYLGGLAITFQGNIYKLEENKPEKLAAMIRLLNQIESEMRANFVEYKGTKEFKHQRIHEVFTNKKLRFDLNNERGNLDQRFTHFVENKDWFVFETLYTNSEEKDFVEMFDRQIETLEKKYEEIYLLRNEGHLEIYNFDDGQVFQPDFVLFLRQKSGETLTYQVFIEPKGSHLIPKDQWKLEFLKQITAEFGDKVLRLDVSKYRLIGLPFYTREDENRFIQSMNEALN